MLSLVYILMPTLNYYYFVGTTNDKNHQGFVKILVDG